MKVKLFKIFPSNKTYFFAALTLVVSFFLLFTFFKYKTNGYLMFSDGAKFADIAGNLFFNKGFKADFSFFSPTIFKLSRENYFSARGISVAMPYSIFLGFKVFKVSDLSVIAVSALFYIFLVITVFLLAKKIFGVLIGFFTAVSVSADLALLGYSVSGASESLFIFQIAVLFILLSFQKRTTDLFAVVVSTLMYLTRPQAFIYILGGILFWFLLRFTYKKTILLFLIIVLMSFLVDRFVLSQFNSQYLIYSITGRGINALSATGISESPSTALRGESGKLIFDFTELGKKIFYNLYNFYRLMPQIMNPYLWGLFVISLFVWSKNKVVNAFKISTIFMVTLTFFVAAATIPFFRYIHPVIPLVYLFGVEMLVLSVGRFTQDLQFKIYHLKINISKSQFLVLASCFLILFLAVGQTLGVIFLDSRFERKTYNVGKPPVYAQLSWILKDNTEPNHVIITNLDTWGSWYGERKTIWFPLEPKQLIDPMTGQIPFDAIYLTSYLINDENYYMGDSWRQIFLNPENPEKWICDGCDEIKKEFILKGIYAVPASDNYQKEDASSILLVRKS